MSYSAVGERACRIVMAVFLTVNLLTSSLMNWYNRAVALKER